MSYTNSEHDFDNNISKILYEFSELDKILNKVIASGEYRESYTDSLYDLKKKLIDMERELVKFK